MSKSNIKELINTFSQLGQQLSTPDEALSELIHNEHIYNAWFTPASVETAVKAIGAMLNDADLTTWLSNYNLTKNTLPKKV